MSRVKKIFLSQMTKFRAEVARDFWKIVDDKSDVCAFGDGQNFFGHFTNFFCGKFFRAQLNQIAAAVTKLLRDNFWRATAQIRRVNERVKFAVLKRFHFLEIEQQRNEGTKGNYF